MIAWRKPEDVWGTAEPAGGTRETVERAGSYDARGTLAALDEAASRPGFKDDWRTEETEQRGHEIMVPTEDTITARAAFVKQRYLSFMAKVNCDDLR